MSDKSFTHLNKMVGESISTEGLKSSRKEDYFIEQNGVKASLVVDGDTFKMEVSGKAKDAEQLVDIFRVVTAIQ